MVTSKKPSKAAPKKAAEKEPPPAQKSVVQHAKEIVEKTKAAIAPKPATKHAEQLVAEENGNQDFQVVEVEKLSLLQIMEAAWSAAKDKGDPPLRGCAESHIEKLHAHALAALKAPYAILKGDSVLARFEKEVVRLSPQYKGEG